MDADEREHTFRLSYDSWFSAAQRRPRYGIAFLDELGVLLIGEAYYWIRPSINKEDWAFQSWEQRVGSLTPRFDNNAFATNEALHPLAGAAYYLFAREADLSPFESLGYAVASSALFEFAGEWLEIVSINDLIMTPFAGAPAGEFVFQLSEYLNSAPSRTGAGVTAARYTLGAPGAAFGWQHRARHVQQRNARLPPDNLGLSSAYWHRFRVSYGVGVIENDHLMSGGFQRLEADGEIVAMPGFLREGTFATSFGWGNFSEARLRLAFDGEGPAEASTWFEAALAGYYSQDLRMTPNGLSGNAAMIGYGMGYRYLARRLLNQHDRFAFAHLLGPVGKSWLVWRGLVLKISGAASFDFGAIDSLAFGPNAARFGETDVKSVETKHGYAHVVGVSGRAGIEAAYEGGTVGARAALGTYRSLQGNDVESYVRHDFESSDDIVELGVYWACPVPGSPLELRAEVEDLHRHSRMAPVLEYRDDRSITGLIGARF